MASTGVASVDLPLPIQDMQPPAGEPGALLDLAAMFATAARDLGRARCDTDRVRGSLLAAWSVGPGRDAASTVVAEHAKSAGAEAAVCALATVGLKDYAKEMTRVRAEFEILRNEVSSYQRELVILVTHCPAGEVPLSLRDQCQRLHARRHELLNRHGVLEKVAHQAAMRAAAVFARAESLNDDDLTRLDRVAKRGYSPIRVVRLVFPDVVADTRAGENGADTPVELLPPAAPTPDGPVGKIPPYVPGSGSVVVLVPDPFPRGGGVPGVPPYIRKPVKTPPLKRSSSERWPRSGRTNQELKDAAEKPSGVGPGGKILRDDQGKPVLDAYGKPVRQRLTEAGHSLDKHGKGIREENERFAKPTGDEVSKNQIARNELVEILDNPGTVEVPQVGGRCKGGHVYIAPDGRAVVFDKNGNFGYFSERTYPG